MWHILIRDAKFEGNLDIELAAAGSEATLDLHRLGEAEPDEERFAAADVVIVCHDASVPAATIAKLTRCRLIIRAGVGFDAVDLEAAASRGIAVSNVPDYGTTEVADHAIALLLALVRGTLLHADRIRADPGDWSPLAPPAARRLTGQRFGIVGLGRIGTATALRARALGMQVTFYDPFLPPGHQLGLGLGRAASLHDLLGVSDIVSLHVPLTPETKGLIDAAAFAALPPGGILINTARGPVVDLDALTQALMSGRLVAAGLDVLPQEPPRRSHALIRAWTDNEPWLRGRLIVTPHAAYYSPEAAIDTRRIAIDTAMGFLRTGVARACVNQHLLR